VLHNISLPHLRTYLEIFWNTIQLASAAHWFLFFRAFWNHSYL